MTYDPAAKEWRAYDGPLANLVRENAWKPTPRCARRAEASPVSNDSASFRSAWWGCVVGRVVGRNDM
jgi:hypothetical protein